MERPLIYTEQKMIRFSPEVWAKIEALAKQREDQANAVTSHPKFRRKIRASAVIRDIVEEYLNNRSTKND